MEKGGRVKGIQPNTDTPETTKPLHFCRGFVLYGAALGVEYKPNLLFLFNIYKSS